MTTPNIEELIERLHSAMDDNQFEDTNTALSDAATTLQSQAERIKELELDLDVQAGSIEAVQAANSRLAAERDTLRAQLAAIRAQEPVLVVEKEPDYWSVGHFHEGSKPHIKPTKVWCLPIGTKLFTRPMPAQDVTELVDAAYDEVQRQIVERYRVEKSIGGFWPCCVKAGDGTMDIFVGSKKQAEHVRQALQTACLDGAFMTSKAALSKYKGAK